MTLAFDRSTVRALDAKSGHLHVDLVPVSKANVCPYWGREIPDFRALGLDGARKYMLLRAPEELEKAAGTLNGKPLLDQHLPAFATDHPFDATVGAMGSDAVWEPPYLKARLTVWVGDSIARIESNEQRELSCGYHYDADMTPGVYEGVAFDGVMRNISFNHVALVAEGRAGPDVVIGDCRLEMPTMLKSPTALMVSGAVIATLRPLLAADAKFDLSDALKDVNSGNLADGKDALADSIVTLATPLLAKDQTIEAADVLLALDTVIAMDMDDDEDLTEDEKAELEIAEKAKAKKKVIGDRRIKAKDEPVVIAVDAAAIRASVKTELAADFAALRHAERAVHPHIGDLAVLPDTPTAIFKLALDAAVTRGALDAAKLKAAPAAAYEAILSMISAPGTEEAPIATDSASRTEAKTWMNEMFPTRSKLGRAS